MLQFHKKGKLIAVLIGTVVTLHFGNHLLKPLFAKNANENSIGNSSDLSKKVDIYKI